MASPSVGLLLVATAISLVSCSQTAARPVEMSEPPPVAPPPPSPSCTLAAAVRARVTGLLAEGRLHRALLVMDKADVLCPESAPEGWAHRVGALADIGRHDEARALAAEIGASSRATDGAKTAARIAREQMDRMAAPRPGVASAEATYARAEALCQHDPNEARRQFLEAWATHPPFGRALIGAGLMALQQGDRVEARRLFDRGIEELMRGPGGAKPVVEPGALPQSRIEAWSSSGKVAIVEAHSAVLVPALPDGDASHNPPEASPLRERVRLVGDFAAMAFAPDGKAVASLERGGTIRLWNPSSGTQIRKFDGASPYGTSVVFSPDGKVLASAPSVMRGVAWIGDGPGPDMPSDTVRLWDVSSGKERLLLGGKDPGKDDTNHPIAFSDDGTTLATTLAPNSDKEHFTVRLWDVSSGRAVGTLARAGMRGGDLDEPTSLTFSPDRKRLASAWTSGTVVLFAVGSGKEVRRLRVAGLASLAWSPDGKVLASATLDAVRLWDADSGRLLRTLGGADTVVFGAEGKELVAWSGPTLRVWDPSSGGLLRTLDWHANAVQSLAFRPAASVMAVALHDHSVRFWDLAPKGSFRKLDGHTGPVTSVAFSPEGTVLASGSEDRTVRLWDVSSGRPLRALEGHTGPVQSVAFGGRVLASSSEDKTVRLWDPSSGGSLRTLRGHTAKVWSVAVSPDGKVVASGSEDTTARLWDVSSGRTLHKLGPRPNQAKSAAAHPIRSVLWSPSGELLATASQPDASHHGLTLWDGASGKSVLEMSVGQPAAFSPDGKLLASGSAWHGRFDLREVSSGNNLRQFKGDADRLQALAWSADGRWVAAGSEDGSIVLFDPATGAVRMIFRASRDQDGGYVATADGFVDFVGTRGDAGGDAPRCRIGALSFPFAVCEERFLLPDLVARALAGDTGYREP